MVGAIVKVKWSAGLLGDGKKSWFRIRTCIISNGCILICCKADGFVDNFLKEKCQEELI